ncbi:MAG: ComEC/Rec2 family competence protein [Candidatus Paceibacterota bacterium]
MSHQSKKYYLLILTFLLFFINIFLFYQDWKSSHRGLIFAMLDVGQGDALFIESPTGKQIMFDGGPIRKVLGPLQKTMSSFDKSIDMLVITNPDADHIGGFLDILKNYKVNYILESGTLTDSKIYQNLKEEIKKQNIRTMLARAGMRLDIGGGVFIDILFPDRDVSEWATNDGSVVARLSYGKTSIMLTGDATNKTEKIILGENSIDVLKSTILKVGHHGSRTSTSKEFVKAVMPVYAFISDGKDNKYGHPHQDTLDTLNNLGVKIFRTDLLGTIIMKCDTIKPCEIN